MHLRSWLPILLTASTAGCSSYSLSDPGDRSGGTGTFPAEDGDFTGTAPPESEEDVRLLAPAQTDVYVFVANPERDTITRVHVPTLSVDTTSVGSEPRLVQTTPDYRTAVVFNRGDDSVTLVDAETLDKTTVDVRSHLNELVLSPDGSHAVLWHNAAREEDDDPVPGGLQSFNEVSFVRVETGEHFPMAVGFNPRMVRFTPDSSLAVVVADAYLATIDLTAETLQAKLIELVPELVDPPVAEEVIVAADGSFAWVRQFGATELLVVDLLTGGINTLPAGDNPTDLDLSADGTEAIAVARGSRELWIYEADAPQLPPRVLSLPQGAPYGSLLMDPSGDQGILYTTASLVEQFAVWDRATDEIRERSLVKPVDGVAINPTGESLLVFHTLEDGLNTEPVFSGSWALTLVALDDLRSNPLLLPAEPTGYAHGTDGAWGFFVMEERPYLEVLDYHTQLHTELTLRSLPSFVGVLPDLDPGDGDSPPAWISQQHELGRISFYDPDEQSLETLTGFELNSEIE
ncbi:MAG TPA: hypothetical protein ENK18_11675 [Deltaproteobacteria bacterium]|nr:hypothetical protein [Deltaproteobacteria bacterium]